MNWKELRYLLPILQGSLLGIPLLLISLFFFFQWKDERDARTLQILEAGQTAFSSLVDRQDLQLYGRLKALRDDPSLLLPKAENPPLEDLWVLSKEGKWTDIITGREVQEPSGRKWEFRSEGLVSWKSQALSDNPVGGSLWGSILIPWDTFFLWKKILGVDFLFSRENGDILFTTLTTPYGEALTGKAPFLPVSGKFGFYPPSDISPALLTAPLAESPGITLTVLNQEPFSGDKLSLLTLLFFTLSWFSAASLGLFILIRFLLKPLQVLRLGIEKILHDYDSGAQAFHPIPIQSKNEIGAAAQAFNHVGSELFNLLSKMNTLNQALFESNRLKDEILSNTSHELRTPLNGIISASQLLLAENLSAHQTEHLRLISDAGQRLQSTINALLDYSEVIRAPQEPVKRDFSLRDVIIPLWDSILPLARKKRLLTTVDLPSLPKISGQPEKLRKALVQILDNSFKFTPHGYICLTATRHENSVHLLVADSGVGIPHEAIGKIFQPFTQGFQGLNRPYTGLGLGLSLAKELVEQSGGKITLQSEPGQGTTVTLTLPLSPDPVSEPEYHHSNRHRHPSSVNKDSKPPEPSPSRPVSLLIVDDEPSNLYLLTRLVRQMGYDAVPAEGGHQALQRIESGWLPTLILLDIMMPDMDGLEVTRKLREKFTLSELPIILFSAKSQSADIIQGMEAGANDYLVKPLNREELQARLRPYVNIKQQHDLQKSFVPVDVLGLLHDGNHQPPFLGDSRWLDATILVFRLTLPREDAGDQGTDLIHLLNSFFIRLGPSVRDWGGVIFEFRSDGFSALFPKEPEGALKAGLLILQTLEGTNRQRAEWGQPILPGSIGVHTGKVTLGLGGEPRFMAPIILSPDYGLAHHVQKQTYFYRASLVCSGSTLQEVTDRKSFSFRYLGMKKEEPVEPLYQVFPLPLPHPWEAVETYRESFERAVFFLETGSYLDAGRILDDLAGRYPEDLPLQILKQSASARESRELIDLPLALDI